ncbi:hypothetical protein ACFVYD_26600 [Streptomyces sp. NPDC058301]|uniref:hypothetical protein n=1 Tax=Streptomyces sp. NPDC058301 TaxID=3346436 RepID=UPI0036E300E2
MLYEYDLIVVGAGPYGRSIAAHATAAGLHLRLLGRRTQRAALPVDERTVTAVRPYGRDGFEVVTADGESMRTRTVALALGPAPFTEPALPAREFRARGGVHGPAGTQGSPQTAGHAAAPVSLAGAGTKQAAIGPATGIAALALGLAAHLTSHLTA